MLTGWFAMFLNTAGLWAFSSILVIGIIAVGSKLNPQYLDSYSLQTRYRMLWLVGLSPWVIASLAVVLATVSEASPIFFNYLGIFHLHHNHVFTIFSWHGAFVSLSLGATLYLLLTSLKRLRRSHRQVREILAFANLDATGYCQLETELPAAFTAGFFQPCYFITSGLRDRLNDYEHLIVRLHEEEHARNYDPLKKWLFQFLTSFFPRNTSLFYNQAMALTMELRADSAVAQAIPDKSVIASTMLKVKRLTASANVQPLNASVCHFGLDQLESRIGFLLTEHHADKSPLLLSLFALICLPISCVVGADIFHHLVEYVLSH